MLISNTILWEIFYKNNKFFYSVTPNTKLYSSFPYRRKKKLNLFSHHTKSDITTHWPKGNSKNLIITVLICYFVFAINRVTLQIAEKYKQIFLSNSQTKPKKKDHCSSIVHRPLQYRIQYIKIHPIRYKHHHTKSESGHLLVIIRLRIDVIYLYIFMFFPNKTPSH